MRALHPRHLLEPLLGGVGVEGEHETSRTGAQRPGQLGVGGVLLAFDGDALHAEAGGDGEGLEPALRLAVEAFLAADPEAVSGGAGDKQHHDDAPGAAAAVERSPAGRTLLPAKARQVKASEPPLRHGDAARKQRVVRSHYLASPSVGAYRLHDASSRIQRTNSPKERPL